MRVVMMVAERLGGGSADQARMMKQRNDGLVHLAVRLKNARFLARTDARMIRFLENTVELVVLMLRLVLYLLQRLLLPLVEHLRQSVVCLIQ